MHQDRRQDVVLRINRQKLVLRRSYHEIGSPPDDSLCYGDTRQQTRQDLGLSCEARDRSESQSPECAQGKGEKRSPENVQEQEDSAERPFAPADEERLPQATIMLTGEEEALIERQLQCYYYGCYYYEQLARASQIRPGATD